jgi:hypothetical protein
MKTTSTAIDKATRKRTAVTPRPPRKPKKPFRLIAPRAKTTRFFHVRFTALEKPVQKSAHTQLARSAREFAWLFLKEHARAYYDQHCRLHGDPLSSSGVSANPPPPANPHHWN